jgi:hypothetical protein
MGDYDVPASILQIISPRAEDQLRRGPGHIPIEASYWLARRDTHQTGSQKRTVSSDSGSFYLAAAATDDMMWHRKTRKTSRNIIEKATNAWFQGKQH